MFLNKQTNNLAGGNNSLNTSSHTSALTTSVVISKVSRKLLTLKTTLITFASIAFFSANTAYAACSADIDMNTKKIINLGTPTASTDAVNKSYVDDKIFSTFSHPNYSRDIDLGTTPLVDNTWLEIIPKGALGRENAIYMCAIYSDYITDRPPYRFSAAIGVAGTYYWGGSFNTEFKPLSFMPHDSDSAAFVWRYTRDSVAHTWGVEIKLDDDSAYNWDTAGKKLYIRCVKM